MSYHTVVLFVAENDAEYTFAAKGFDALAGMVESICKGVQTSHTKLRQIESNIEDNVGNEFEGASSFNLKDGYNLLIEFNQLPPGLIEK